MILWDEYIAAYPGGYSHSRFCELYRAFEKTLSVTMRQTHAAGERLFVDYAGDGVPVVIDRLTGEIRMARIFVALFGASSFTFAKATWTGSTPTCAPFGAIDGVPELVASDHATDIAGLFGRVAISGPSARFLIENPRMGLGS